MIIITEKLVKGWFDISIKLFLQFLVYKSNFEWQRKTLNWSRKSSLFWITDYQRHAAFLHITTYNKQIFEILLKIYLYYWVSFLFQFQLHTWIDSFMSKSDEIGSSRLFWMGMWLKDNSFLYFSVSVMFVHFLQYLPAYCISNTCSLSLTLSLSLLLSWVAIEPKDEMSKRKNCKIP